MILSLYYKVPTKYKNTNYQDDKIVVYYIINYHHYNMSLKFI